VPTVTLAESTIDKARLGVITAPVVVAVAHNKGGVGKTTSTLIIARHLSQRLRVELVDMDETRYLREAVHALSRRGDAKLSPRLWLREAEPQEADCVLVDSPPARGPHTRAALTMADYVVIPAPPEPMAVLAMQLMLDIVDEIRVDRRQGNPFLQVLGVIPTMYDRRWPEHTGWLRQMADVCAERNVRVFPAIPRKQSIMLMSMAGQDYAPVAAAIAQIVRRRRTESRQPDAESL
jgi:cellulose biosynthesis protein BcsQ